MEQKRIIKNISGTVCVIGLALSTVNMNSTMLIDGNYEIPSSNYSSYYSESTSNPYAMTSSNIYEQKVSTRLEDETRALFGTMRDATPEENKCVSDYIKSISKDTGVNFFDIC